MLLGKEQYYVGTHSLHF